MINAEYSKLVSNIYYYLRYINWWIRCGHWIGQHQDNGFDDRWIKSFKSFWKFSNLLTLS
jgi:hypothetical protein